MSLYLVVSFCIAGILWVIEEDSPQGVEIGSVSDTTLLLFNHEPYNGEAPENNNWNMKFIE